MLQWFEVTGVITKREFQVRTSCECLEATGAIPLWRGVSTVIGCDHEDLVSASRHHVQRLHSKTDGGQHHKKGDRS